MASKDGMMPLRWRISRRRDWFQQVQLLRQIPALRCDLRIRFSTFHHIAALLATLLMFASVSPATTQKTTQKKSSSKPAKHSTKSKKSSKKTARKVRGQRSIDEQRAQQIQTALIREHYLDGEPSGQWDQRTKEAMQRYQADHGWQTKTVPDARALIKLGLGPSKENLINPETAATAAVPATAPERSGGSAFRQ